MIATPLSIAYNQYCSPYPEEISHSPHAKSHPNQGLRRPNNEYNNCKPYSGKKRQRKWSKERSDRDENRSSSLVRATSAEDRVRLSEVLSCRRSMSLVDGDFALILAHFRALIVKHECSLSSFCVLSGLRVSFPRCHWASALH